MKRKEIASMKKVVGLLLVFIMLSGLFTATAFAAPRKGSLKDITSATAPFNYASGSLFQLRNPNGEIVQSAKGTTNNYIKDRHDKLLAAGWEFQGVTVEEFEAPAAAQSSTSSVVIIGYQVVQPYYTQPIQSKSSYNSDLLDGIASVTTPVVTLISAAVPKAKWVPKTVGFLTLQIIELSARKKSTFSSPSTLRFYDVQVKVEGWPNYFTRASSERYEASVASTFAGYKEDGTPFTTAATGDGAVQSTHYKDYTYLQGKAREYVLKDDGSVYKEYAPDLTTITVK